MSAILKSALARVTGELERLDPQSAAVAYARGVLDGCGVRAVTVRSGRPPKQADDRDREMAAAYAEGMTLLEVGAKFATDFGTATRAIKRAGGEIRPKGSYKKERAPDPRLPAMIAMRADGRTLEEIGAAHNIARERARQILFAAGVDTSHDTRPITPEQKAAVERYLAGDSLGFCASSVGITDSRMRSLIQKSGHVLRPVKSAKKLAADKLAARVAALYVAGDSPRLIAEKLNLSSPERVYRYLARAGVKPDRRSPFMLADGTVVRRAA